MVKRDPLAPMRLLPLVFGYKTKTLGVLVKKSSFYVLR